MLRTSRVNRCVQPLVALAVVLGLLDVCRRTSYNITATTATITVFEDSDADGQLDTDEPAIPNVLVVAGHNIHGLLTRTASMTDERGQVTVSAEYTHFFDIEVVPPCGSRATTDTAQSAADQPELLFGFVPETIRSGTAIVRFRLWDDQNGDSLQDADEPLLNGVDLVVEPWQPVNADNWGGTLALTTDAEGWATLELGNSCGRFWVRAPSGRVTTATVPDPVEEAYLYREGWLAFSYDLGTTEIEWGVQTSETPQAPTGVATP